MKYLSILIFLIISIRVSAFSTYPKNFPQISCDEYWKSKHIENTYNKKTSYKKYYQSLHRKQCYKEWTVLVFMAADNDLTPYALWDIYEMERKLADHPNKGASTNLTDVIVELDTYRRNGINRYHIFQTNKKYNPGIGVEYFYDHHQEMIDSPIIKSYLETNNTVKDQSIRLERFITQSIRNYPSKHYMLVIWGHGEGYIGSNFRAKLGDESLPRPTSKGNNINAEDVGIESLSSTYQIESQEFPYDKVFGGVAFDYTDISFLDIPSIKNTINYSLEKLDYNRPLDILAFDACLMQNLEVATELADSTNFIIGSTQIQDYLGLPYRMILDTLNNKQNISPTEVAKLIPKLMSESMGEFGYQGYINPVSADMFTASSISTTILKQQFVPSFLKFSNALIDYIEEDMFRMLDFQVIFENSPSFRGETRDVGLFIATIEQMLYNERINNKETLKGIHLKNSIINLWDDLNQMVYANTFGPYYTDPKHSYQESYFLNYFKGMSIWIPSSKKLFNHRKNEFLKSAFYNKFTKGSNVSPFYKLLDAIYNQKPKMLF